ncbi:hypothetical protein ABZ208_06505 [Streptomyces sp. NPDC006208]|uniref:hypothetical protein n=1 Tax=Streptomyces sp. NPDC006208 TaxID=3156734 RepID=UPI00339ED1EF
MNLRMFGITALVVCGTLLPLTASAGPAHGPRRDAGRAEAEPAGDAKSDGEPHPRTGASDMSDVISGAYGRRGADGARDTGEPDGAPDARPLTASRCGPEVASPEGVEAQTCVLDEGRDTWARVYYRNATGEELTSVLTLMAPGGRTLQTNCLIGTGDEPGACDTPKEPSRGAASAYWAVTEFAISDGADDGPLLLRSGSNSPTANER